MPGRGSQPQAQSQAQAQAQAQAQPPMHLLAQHAHAHPHAHAHAHAYVHPHSHTHTQPHPQTAADLPLSVSSLMHVLRDAEHLTARYGSTSAACARLEELEHAYVDQQTQLATLQQKLSMAMVAAAAAQVDSHHSGKSIDRERERERDRQQPLKPFSADALLGFLQRHCACRGNVALLHVVLQDFQRSLVLPPDARFPSRDVLLSVHEILPVDHEQSQHAQMQEAPPHQSPQREKVARKKTHEQSRLTPMVKMGNGVSSPLRPATEVTPPRAIAPAAGRNGHLTGAVGSPAMHASASGAGGRSAQPLVPTDRRAQREEKQQTKAAIVLSALSRPSSASSSNATMEGASTQAQAKSAADESTVERRQTSRRSSGDSNASAKKRTSLRKHDDEMYSEAAAEEDDASSHRSAAVEDQDESGGSKRKRASSVSASTAAEPISEIVVKQNLSLPHDKRNIVELKQSSQLLTLPALDELSARAPWDEVYKLRSTFSHILDFQALTEPARRWFVSALRVQFVWRREFWERLHWLPMSDSICSGGDWEKYRQTRKRRANKAIAAWRKVYSDSLELMRKRQLPEDVWCDVALWYMPSTPLYWLPTSADLTKELDVVDAKHPVRCYHVKELSKHPFYSDHELQRKYPDKHELPSPQLLALQNEDKESRVTFTPE